MLTNKIDLYEYFKRDRNGAKGGYLDCYIQENSREINLIRKHPAMLVMPGGGYAYVSDREAFPIAIEFLHKNYSCFILNYSIAPDSIYPTQLLEAAMAMLYIRNNCEKLNIISNKIAAAGFSAGGHLCASLATCFDDENLVKSFGNDCEKVRPDAVILGYPVISSKFYVEFGSFKNLTAENPELAAKLSIEEHVSEKSSPAFIWHTLEDGCVPVENSLMLANAYKKFGVPFELHIFEKGQHGMSSCNHFSDKLSTLNEKYENNSAWINLSLNWLNINGFHIDN